MRAADIVARRLRAAGVTRAYGMPGGEVLTLLDALRAAGIEFVLCHHETAGGFMAEGGHHVDGAPAVLLATVGPGIANAFNFVANAQQDRVPVIVLTGCVDPVDAATYTHQVFDHRAAFGPVCKATFTLEPGAAAVQVDRAVRIATAPRPGPVLIDVPISAAEADVEGDALVRPVPARATAHADALAEARAWLAEAERPIVLAGLDALRDGAGGALGALADAGVPIVTTYKGKGLVPEDHPAALGGAGLSPLADGHLLPLFREADAILLAGYDPIEMRAGWRDVWDPARQRVIDVCAVPNDHGMHGATMEIVADVRDTVAGLAAAVRQRPLREEAVAARAALRAAFAPEGWGPGAAIAAARAACPADTIATVDSGAHRILLSQQWDCAHPGTLLQSTGLCTMGCALPLAIGAKRAAPSAPVVGFMGDAGFLMCTGELASAAALEVPVVFVVFVDASLALIEKKQRGAQLANVGVDFARHDYAAIAQGFGGRGATVSDAEAMEAAMREALAADTFTVIAVEIDRRAYDGRI